MWYKKPLTPMRINGVFFWCPRQSDTVDHAVVFACMRAWKGTRFIALGLRKQISREGTHRVCTWAISSWQSVDESINKRSRRRKFISACVRRRALRRRHLSHAVHISNFLPSAILIDWVGARGWAACHRLARALLIHYCRIDFNWKPTRTFHFAISNSH